MRIPAAVISTVLLVSTLAVAEEKKIQRSDLPTPVEKAVAAHSQGAAIKGFSVEKKDDHTYYEVEMTVSGHSKDVTFDPTGAVVEAEEQVAFDTLPAAVKEGLQAEAGAGKILKVESISKHDKVVAYEAKVQNAGKRSEIQVGLDGKPLDHEE